MPHVKAVIFDAFGTVVRINDLRHPYRQLLKHGRKQRRQIRTEDVQIIMTNPMTLGAAAARFGISLAPADLKRLQTDLEQEIQSIDLFKDTLAAIGALKSAGIKVGVCSNLAAPYGEPLKRLLPVLDAYAFSFEIGAMKPEPEMYQAILDHLGVEAHETWMIGDSLRCDRDGPSAFGIKGHYLDRYGNSGNYAGLKEFVDLMVTC